MDGSIDLPPFKTLGRVKLRVKSVKNLEAPVMKDTPPPEYLESAGGQALLDLLPEVADKDLPLAYSTGDNDKTFQPLAHLVDAVNTVGRAPEKRCVFAWDVKTDKVLWTYYEDDSSKKWKFRVSEDRYPTRDEYVDFVRVARWIMEAERKANETP